MSTIAITYWLLILYQSHLAPTCYALLKLSGSLITSSKIVCCYLKPFGTSHARMHLHVTTTELVKLILHVLFVLSRSLTSESSMTRSTSRKLRSWLSTLHGDRDAQARREQRKGWTVTIHDLSGSPVAMASMVTPFVPSPAGSGRVSRANPGAWLILQPTGAGPASWKSWARLEAWRERGPVDALGYRLELVFDSGPTECAVPIAESSISTKRGGQFVIDPATFPVGAAGAAWPFAGGFVMGSTAEGEGRASRPTVQVGVQHATCMGDVALFVALAAAVDLCMDACKLFSQRLRKELCHDQED